MFSEVLGATPISKSAKQSHAPEYKFFPENTAKQLFNQKQVIVVVLVRSMLKYCIMSQENVSLQARFTCVYNFQLIHLTNREQRKTLTKTSLPRSKLLLRCF